MKKIWLADLTHTGAGVATEAFPLNIGLIAAYASKHYQNEKLNFELFKYPDELNSKLKKEVPDIMGFSNYTWNSNLAYYFTNLVKKVSPNTAVVWGGTNYPYLSREQKIFLEKRPDLDFHIYYEGEKSFLNLLDALRDNSLANLKESKIKIAGVQYLSGTEFVSGPEVPRITDLDSIPSPYVIGLLDKFFDGVLTPLVETTRGCPFRCNYCNAGDIYFNKVHQFSEKYIEEELTYIAEKAGPLGIGHLTFCDNNFGMLSRDAETAKLLAKLKTVHKFPGTVTVWTGKNSKNRVIEATKILGDTLNISMSVQAMDNNVLKQIKRDNIDLDSYRSIANHLNSEGRPQHAEVIMPLPGETFQSHISGLKELVDTNVDRVFSHTLQMLHGTEYKDNDTYRNQFEFKTKFRLVPLDFTRLEDSVIFDVEEVAVASKDMSFNEYCSARLFALIIDLSFNSNILKPIIKFARENNILASKITDKAFSEIKKQKYAFSEVIESFEIETQSELWDNEKMLTDFYSLPENYARLVSGEIGGNVLFKHRVWILTGYAAEWIEFISNLVYQLYKEMNSDYLHFSEMLLQVRKFSELTIKGAFEENSINVKIIHDFDYNFSDWLSPSNQRNLQFFNFKTQIQFEIPFSKRKIITDARTRYGNDLKGNIKLIQRTNYTPAFVPTSYLKNATEPVSQNEFYHGL